MKRLYYFMLVLIPALTLAGCCDKCSAPKAETKSEEATPATTTEQPAQEAQPAKADEAQDATTEETQPSTSTSSTVTTETRKAMAGTNDQWIPATADDTNWIAKEKASHFLKPQADNSSLMNGTQKAGHTYKNVTKQDLILWERETERLVVEGSRIFHNADLLGSTNATSCDMCHPDGSNTHPETYPKYQVQLGRAALLRDMINWCLENPCRGKPLSGDDPRMRALEAYINAMSSGKTMDYGKH